MQFRLNQRSLSELAWRQLFDYLSLIDPDRVEKMRTEVAKLEKLRSLAQYNTGSISAFGALAAFSLAAFVRPQLISEVGTFIGRSAVALSLGAQAGGADQVQVHTCDSSNSFEIPRYDGIDLIQYPRQTSVQMFTSLLQLGKSPQLFHIDGRLGTDDVQLLSRFETQGAFFLLDDFEGIEKGIANAFVLQQILGASHILLYPPVKGSYSGGVVDLFKGEASCAIYAPREAFLIAPQ